MTEYGKREAGGRVAGERGGEGHAPGLDRRTGPSRLVPGTPLGYALAVLSVLILGIGAYAAAGPVRELAGHGLPGPGAPDSGEGSNLEQTENVSAGDRTLFRTDVPGSEGPGFGQIKAQGRTAAGAKVTVGWAYADAGSVVVGYTIEDLDGGRRVAGNPAELQPAYANGVRLTDESGTEYRLASGGGEGSPGPNNIVEGPLANSAVFEPVGWIEPGDARHFRLEIPLQERPLTPLDQGEEIPEPEPVAERPFVFDFEIPVRPALVTEVDQKTTASGITLTLERVTDSPGRPKAVVCLESTDDVRGWYPVGEDLGSEAPSPLSGEGNCLEMLLNDPLDGPSSVTVAQIEVCPTCAKEELISGPWRFDFEVPGQ